MDERRSLERFELSVPARVLVRSGNNKIEEYSLTTRDMSSAGAFLYSSEPLPEGASARMEFLISPSTFQDFVGNKRKARVRVKGQVIRSDSNGVAIRFDSAYKITAFDSHNLKNGLS